MVENKDVGKVGQDWMKLLLLIIYPVVFYENGMFE